MLNRRIPIPYHFGWSGIPQAGVIRLSVDEPRQAAAELSEGRAHLVGDGLGRDAQGYRDVSIRHSVDSSEKEYLTSSRWEHGDGGFDASKKLVSF